MLPTRAPSSLPENHPDIVLGRVGVLLVNLGTPEKPDAKAVRGYLREFLSDRRVVDYPRLLWWPLLNGIILNTRPSKTAKLYREIWNQVDDESPLKTFTRRQAEYVGDQMDENVVTRFAMRYGEPSIRFRIEEMQAAGCDKILIVPLYPQYSATTTGTVVDEVGRVLSRLAHQPTIRIAPPFYDAAPYIDALMQSARRHLKPDTERVILSFHGIPQRFFDAGDPYHCHCKKTARLLCEKMGWTDDFVKVGFQSRFGPEQWLEPSTESLVLEAASEGLDNIAVMAPSFVSDCLETLEEIGISLAKTFTEAGGTSLNAIPCLNDDKPFVDFLSALTRNELSGWTD
ncbi:MAG: ferrochelatase [Parvularcula sp.]